MKHEWTLSRYDSLKNVRFIFTFHYQFSKLSLIEFTYMNFVLKSEKWKEQQTRHQQTQVKHQTINSHYELTPSLIAVIFHLFIIHLPSRRGGQVQQTIVFFITMVVIVCRMSPLSINSISNFRLIYRSNLQLNSTRITHTSHTHTLTQRKITNCFTLVG